MLDVLYLPSDVSMISILIPIIITDSLFFDYISKVTEEYITTGFSPCYFCDNCFASFHNENDTVSVKEYCGTAGGDLKRHTY